MCGCYIWCEDSPAYNVVNVDFFDILENDIASYNYRGKVLIFGDFNSRTCNKCDYIIHDTFNIVTDDIDYNPDVHSVRASVD